MCCSCFGIWLFKSNFESRFAAPLKFEKEENRSSFAAPMMQLLCSFFAAYLKIWQVVKFGGRAHAEKDNKNLTKIKIWKNICSIILYLTLDKRCDIIIMGKIWLLRARAQTSTTARAQNKKEVKRLPQIQL